LHRATKKALCTRAQRKIRKNTRKKIVRGTEKKFQCLGFGKDTNGRGKREIWRKRVFTVVEGTV